MKLVRYCVVLSLALLSCNHLGYAAAYDAKPKLVVVLVFDQFRGDYLDRFRADFKTPYGWNLFLNQGAHFTDCYYDFANLLTAAGHATIGTGAYTDGHAIPVNEWWQTYPDGSIKHISSVDDERYFIVDGTPAKSLGASPAKEVATTWG